MTTDRTYFASAALAVANLNRQGLQLDTETNSPFNYADAQVTRDAGIRSDVIGYWIEYRRYA
jgi:hypothetical protein